MSEFLGQFSHLQQRQEEEAFIKELKNETFTEILYLICIYQKTIRIKMITIQNQRPVYCELLEEIEIDTEQYYKNTHCPTKSASSLLNMMN